MFSSNIKMKSCINFQGLNEIAIRADTPLMDNITNTLQFRFTKNFFQINLIWCPIDNQIIL